MVLFESLGMVSYSSSIATMAISLAVSEISSDKQWRDLETGGRGRSRSLEMAPCESFGTISYWRSIVTISLTCIILEVKRDIGRRLQFLRTPLAFNAPVRGTLLGFCHNVWYGKTRMVGLPDGKNI